MHGREDKFVKMFILKFEGKKLFERRISKRDTNMKMDVKQVLSLNQENAVDLHGVSRAP